MASYKTVSWQEYDEVTSDKLDQMSQNDTWIKDNMILGDARRVKNGDYSPNPLEVGVSRISRIDAVVKPFNSQVSTAWMDMDVNIPDGHTNIPIVIHSVGGDVNDGFSSQLISLSLQRATFRITQLDHISKVLNGTIHVLFVGY